MKDSYLGQGVLQCIAVCCSVLQCVAVYCSVLQCVAVYCSVLQCVKDSYLSHNSFTRVPRLYQRHDSLMYVRTGDMTHLYVRHDSFILVT